jgi:phenylalanine-4-hydroxylase
MTLLKQAYEKYTDQDQRNWTILFSRVMQMLPEVADPAVVKGLKQLGFPADHIPDFDDINAKLSAFTEWRIVSLDEMVDDKQFIAMLADKVYPCRTWLRDTAHVESGDEVYDMFHDVVGHTPLLTLPRYADYLHGLGKLALEHMSNDKAILCLKRVYWHTIQFGLREDNKTLKIYGAHLLSSPQEVAYSLGAGVPKYDLNIPLIMDTPYVKGSFQEKYFSIDDFDELYNSLELIRKELDQRFK